MRTIVSLPFRNLIPNLVDRDMLSLLLDGLFPQSGNVKQRLQLFDEQPFLVRNIWAVEFLECVDTSTADERVQGILFFKMSAVSRLMGAHFDLDCNGRLPLLAYLNLLVIALNRSAGELLADILY